MLSTGAYVLISSMSFIVFCSSYVFIIQPMVFYLFGFRKSGEEKVPTSEQLKYQDDYAPPHKESDSGIIAAILPLYAFGIFVYFAYIIFKLTSNRRNVTPQNKEGYLKDYYRNFRYVPEKGKFQMDSDCSDDEKDNGLRNFRPEYDIGWSPAPDNQDQTPDIYRSIAGLPKDLEYLLKKADDENLGS
ncbi:unnamed protein product [Hymenolepis diminuta]|uniref:Resistance to inhibitors of cholinesterase protein 3 N-terminal domain-containing protein n=1 Tax=Hymenolepis diminuta TaxID=6216 RepID=A0A564YQ81_HYMDI|nr:unnamed protein product [Hymenolepis diminuta]